METQLLQIAVFLAAAAIAAPLARFLGLGSVLGYLAAGVFIGPFGLGLVYSLYEVESVLHFAEFGVVLLLFLIGLELRLVRLWSMRQSIFGVGGAQLALTSILLAAAAVAFGLPVTLAVFLGLALSLSSTAFALQVLEERKELTKRHGRLAFSVLLFQDLAAIPLIALVPVFAAGGPTAASMNPASAVIALVAIAAVVLVGRFVLSRVYRLVAATGVREAMTASALLTVVSVAILMELVGLSAALGAFIAGALLADSEYRNQIQADIAPFEGLLLGLFFVAIGMSLDLGLLLREPLLIGAIVLGLVGVKIAILYGLGRWQGLKRAGSVRLGIVLSQGGEFAFVLLAAGAVAGVVDRHLSDLLVVAVTLSMVATPLLLIGADMLIAPPAKRDGFDRTPDEDGHIIIAGFGRVGQIVARVLRARHIRFTALDIDPSQIDVVKRFGGEVYYGDGSRLDILRAAGIEKARAIVLAMDDVEATVRAAESIRQAFPGVAVYARARNRQHVHRLLDAGVQKIFRETFHSALELTKGVLRGLGEPEADVKRIVEMFRKHDEARLYEDYKDYTNEEKLRSRALSSAKELEELFARDLTQQAEEQAAVSVESGAPARSIATPIKRAS